MPSLFSKIIAGDIPCRRLYENELIIAILTIEPIVLGHCLIIPKSEIDSYLDVPEPYYSEVFNQAKTLGKVLLKVTGCERVGLIVQGLEVPHFHLHVIPINSGEDMLFSNAKKRSEKEMDEIQEKILSQIRTLG